ncbi:hypothetical protein [Streptosporangium canum]|uniref:hypothetical protein n=1 Tax=Streptosporangium canum TaxID=324952 RepID=UPI0037AE654C
MILKGLYQHWYMLRKVVSARPHKAGGWPRPFAHSGRLEEAMMITMEPHRPVRTIALPRRNHHGGHSPAWLLVQAAQLSWEIHSILTLIHGARLNLTEELSVQYEATRALMDAAHASVIVESRLPLAPSWSSGVPRPRSVFAQAREAGSDPQSVIPEMVVPAKPDIAAEHLQALAEASRPDRFPHAQCAGVNLKGTRCAKRIFTGIGAEHCHMHLTTAEKQRREQLRAAREQVRQAEEDAVECQQVALAQDWIDRYGRRPHRVELPTLPPRLHQITIPQPGIPEPADTQPHAIIALHETGWLTICPRAGEIIRAFLDASRASPQEIAAHAAAQAPGRWVDDQHWLSSNIWDGIQPPLDHMPAAGEAPELDEYPGVHTLRLQMISDEHIWARWHTGFSALVQACDHPAVETMADLLAFWQHLGILTQTQSADTGSCAGPQLTVGNTVHSPWRVLHATKCSKAPDVLMRAVRFLIAVAIPWDHEIPPYKILDLVRTTA